MSAPGVLPIGETPGESEFSHGEGMMPPLDKAPPKQWMQHVAQFHTDPSDPSSVIDYKKLRGEE